jgi:uncharacterized protein YgbK (DUF1537 family)
MLYGGAAFHVVPVGVIERGPEAFVAEIEIACRDVRNFVVDATSDQHLAQAAAAVHMLESNHDVLTISSGAWLSHYPWSARKRRVVVVAIGLPTATTERQLEELLRRTTTAHLMTVRQAMHLAVKSSADFQAELNEAEVLIVKASPDEEGFVPPHTDGDRIVAGDAVARAVDALLATAQRFGYCCDGVVVTGAYTAASVIRSLGGSAVLPTDDTPAHTPAACIVSGDWTGLRVVTKGGLVGGPETLFDLVAALWRTSPMGKASSGL